MQYTTEFNNIFNQLQIKIYIYYKQASEKTRRSQKNGMIFKNVVDEYKTTQLRC